MMNNNQALKATLAQKAAEIKPVINFSPVVGSVQTTAVDLPHTVTVSITVPLADAARYLQQLQKLLHVPNSTDLPSGESQQRPVNLQATPNAVLPAAGQAVKESPVVSPDRLSDKQKNMILNLSKRKKVAAEQMATLLKDRFGVEDGTLLSKRQASQLIDLLMAQ